ncbi:hypothetical protein AXG93_4424s1000 [Marchantia polymorpha subsp. ruderalis]|uniref:Uncharacterized protein n=1 Tax=Marchantia polymorpha subsp. ruderalis TaxID=1480154 RepID=A0A176VX17_MARPO|nr:hypothetical protein AXG93_4424s1000 [Marchantia polymorpha subsp. ruderalis]
MRSQKSHKRMEKAEEAYRHLRDETTNGLIRLRRRTLLRRSAFGGSGKDKEVGGRRVFATSAFGGRRLQQSAFSDTQAENNFGRNQRNQD